MKPVKPVKGWIILPKNKKHTVKMIRHAFSVGDFFLSDPVKDGQYMSTDEAAYPCKIEFNEKIKTRKRKTK